MKTTLTLLSLLSFCAAALAQETNVLGNGTFDGLTAGSPPPKPWISVIKEGVTGVSVTLAPLPDSTDGKLWVHMLDENPEAPTSLLQSFPEIKSGQLKIKVYFQRVGTAFGIYLGAPKVAAPETRVIDFKVLSKGRLSLGNAGVRAKTEFVFGPNTVYPLVFDFETSADGTKVSYRVTREDTGETIGSAEVDARTPIAGLRVATDSRDQESDVYVTDIILTPKP